MVPRISADAVQRNRLWPMQIPLPSITAVGYLFVTALDRRNMLRMTPRSGHPRTLFILQSTDQIASFNLRRVMFDSRCDSHCP